MRKGEKLYDRFVFIRVEKSVKSNIIFKYDTKIIFLNKINYLVFEKELSEFKILSLK